MARIAPWKPPARRSIARFWKMSISSAKGVLINIAADSKLTLFEVNEAMSLIPEATGPEATIIFGTVIDDSLEGDIRVMAIAVGFNLGQENTIPFSSPGQENRLPALNTEPIFSENPAPVDGPAMPIGGQIDNSPPICATAKKSMGPWFSTWPAISLALRSNA